MTLPLRCPRIDMRVDLHPAAVTELRRVPEEFRLCEDFYRQRGLDPSHAIPRDVSVAQLETRRRA